MFFQKVLKGICGLTCAEATDIVTKEGIHSNWSRLVGNITSVEIRDRLTETEVLRHLNQYNDPLPSSHPLAGAPYNAGTYGEISPFISTTAGAIQRRAFFRQNKLFPPFMTALRFATKNFTKTGYIFYAYLITLGRKTVPLMQYAEEVRDLHIYQQYLPYHHEGEVMGKITIPSIQIEKAEEYDGPAAKQALGLRRIPTPVGQPIKNDDYLKPEAISNVHELL